MIQRPHLFLYFIFLIMSLKCFLQVELEVSAFIPHEEVKDLKIP